MFLMKNGNDSRSSKHFITIKEAAAYVGVNENTFYQWAQKPPSKGGPPVRRFGKNCLRLPRDQFLHWAGLAPEK